MREKQNPMINTYMWPSPRKDHNGSSNRIYEKDMFKEFVTSLKAFYGGGYDYEYYANKTSTNMFFFECLTESWSGSYNLI